MVSKTLVENYKLYNGTVSLDYWPVSHKYVIDDDQKIGVTTITGVINKEALMLWPLQEAMTYLKAMLNPAPLGSLYEREFMIDVLENASKAYLKKQLRGTDAGTAGHEWLESYLRAIKDGTDIPYRMQKLRVNTIVEGSDEYIRATDHNNIVDAIENFIEWMKEHEVKVLDVERIVYSKEYDYCGRFDAILEIDGKNYIIDFKTSNPSRDFALGIYPENFSQLGGYDVAFTEEFPDYKIDGQGVINLSKKTGKLSIELTEDRQTNRDFFIFTLGTKRGMQFWVNKLKYMDKKA